MPAPATPCFIYLDSDTFGTIEIDASQVVSGTFADARISATSVTQHAAAIVTAIATGGIPLAKLAALTASRIVASDSSGVLTVNASLTSGRLVRADGTGSLTSNAALTASRLMSSDASGFPQSNAAGTTNRLAYWDGAGSLAANAAITQNRLAIGDANGLPTPASAITAARMLVSDANGVPTHGNATTTEANFISGLTSAVQTQLDTKRQTGVRHKWINPGMMIGAGTAATRLAGALAGGIYYDSWTFSDTTQQELAWMWAPPKSYNDSTLTMELFWIVNSASTNSVEWQTQNQSFANAESMDSGGYTGSAGVVDANQGTLDLNVTSAISIAPVGSPANGEIFSFKIYRNVASANDNLAATAVLLGIRLGWTCDAVNDS